MTALEIIATLGALLGIGFLSGIRLYSTVLAVGLGIRLGWLDVPAALSQLEVLAQTPVLIAAGTVYSMEFVADKIPIIDSFWDLLHTFIRPLGAALVAATAIGPVEPGIMLAVMLGTGLVALSGHTAKATTRAVVNHSPEPFSNIGLSLGEDALVFAGVWTALTHPLVALAIVVIAVGLIVWLVPKLFRLVREQVTRSVRFVNELMSPEVGP